MTGFRRLFQTKVRRAASVVAPFTLAAAVGLSLAACGGGGHGSDVVLPPGGVLTGELLCTTSFLPNTNQLVQNGQMAITWRLTDANSGGPGANLPVSFEVIGGAVPGPPDKTNGDGYVTVTFIADATYFGTARIALIQPDRHLRCETSLLVLKPACKLTSKVLDGANVVVAGFDYDACGLTEDNLQRNIARKVTYKVTAPDPLTGIYHPVADAHLRLNAVGLAFTEIEVGPTNVDGEVTVSVTPFQSGVGLATLTATVLDPDANHDGFADEFPCNTCTSGWRIIDPVCDGNGGPLVLDVKDAFGVGQGGNHVHPGWTVDATATFKLAGVAQVGFPVLARCSNGTINGSGLPQHLLTGAGGMVTVTYAPNVGYSGMDTIVIEADDHFETCSFSADVMVHTCGMMLTADSGATSMKWATQEAMTLHLDPGMGTPSLIGQTVSVNVTGGYLVPQLPTRLVEAGPGGHPVVHVDFVASLGFEGNAVFTVNYPGGYPCIATQANFPVTRP